MKENVLDVLMYLFETYVDTEEEPEPDQNELRLELARAGFGDTEIDRALLWLDALTDQQQSLDYGAQTAHGKRMKRPKGMNGCAVSDPAEPSTGPSSCRPISTWSRSNGWC